MTPATAAARDAPFAGLANLALYLAVAFVAGAVIALQIALMRVFAVGSWVHFGSLVVSLAMLGFGLASVIMCLARPWFDRHWRGAGGTALVLFGPLTVAATLIAQALPFNPVFLVSDPSQKWRLLANFLLYLMPFLAAAFFLGIVFLKSREAFSRAYFADLTGSGIAGLGILGAMYLLAPEAIIAFPLLLWAFGGLSWHLGLAERRGLAALLAIATVTIGGYHLLPGALDIPAIATSPYKGVAYARNFPDAERVYRNVSPFGDLQVYASSYMHFAPGQSDNAAFNLPDLPPNTFVGMYIDGDGPEGVMRALDEAERDYFFYLPSYYPYVVKNEPETFVVQFGGGISTMVALAAGAPRVTAAIGNPAVLAAFRTDPLRDFTSDLVDDPRVAIVDYDGRLFLAETDKRYDVIDLSLADSVGLSNPGGFAIVEKYTYTREAMLDYMNALADGGILSVTLWNKEEPPKSILKLYATISEAAEEFDPATAANALFVASSYLSTTTVLYKRGGFAAEEIDRLRAYTEEMSFDEIYSPGLVYEASMERDVLDDYRQSIFGDGSAAQPAPTPEDPTTEGTDDEIDDGDATPLPSVEVARLAWRALVSHDWPAFADAYLFDTRPLTNDRPYFAAYVKPQDLTRTVDRLELFQDEWGYLLLWATLAIACALAATLVIIPVVFAWRAAFSRTPGKAGTVLYFACLGLGYIMVEVGLISRFTLSLAHPTVSASVLIAGMLVFSGLGSLVSARFTDRARTVMPVIFVTIAALLFAYGSLLDPLLGWIGTTAYGWRLAICFALIAPPAFLMGFPMAVAMTWLARLGKDEMFIWAWGINGCFSVVGAALVPILATAFGLSAVLNTSAVAYLLAIAGLFALLTPLRDARDAGAGVTSGGQAGRRALGVALALTGGVATLMNGNGPATSAPLAEAKGAYVSFENAPFPYRGIIPRKDIPFIDTVENGRHGHTSPRAGKVYWEDETYSDRRSLIYVPKGFDIDHPAVIVVFFHGNQATLSRDVVDRQRVPHQVAKSGLNAVLLAPQFAVDALDSSSGNFWTPGIFARYLDEAAGRIASVYGDESKAPVFAKLPVVIVAYSGGYNPAAFAVGVGGAADRILGLVLLDAVYAEEDQFAGWIAANKESAFLFSAFTKSAAANNAVLRQLLTERGTRFSRRLPSKLTPGTVAFFATDPDLVHDDFVTHAWVDDPVAWTLSRVPGYRR